MFNVIKSFKISRFTKLKIKNKKKNMSSYLAMPCQYKNNTANLKRQQ